MKDSDIITIYWSPASFTNQDPSWNMLYKAPESVFSKIKRARPQGEMSVCPSMKGLLKKVYSFESTIDDEFDLSAEYLSSTSSLSRNELMTTGSRVALAKARESNFDNFVDITYNLSWAFFSDEPVSARLTAPYFPSFSPVEGAMLAPGEFDIGKWYRPMVLDYHIPIKDSKFVVKKDQPLFFLELKTEKRIEFKRYTLTQELRHLMNESMQATNRYAQNQTLSERYKFAEASSLKERVLKEILKNVI